MRKKFITGSKAFTLIELLVVVAIIGILAAVGVVAYNGYTSAAKVASVKQNFKLIEKYTSAELMKCQIGHDVIFLDSKNKVDCSGLDSPSVMIVAILTDSKLKNIFNPMDTPWGKDQRITRVDNYHSKPIGDDYIGFILISFPTWPGSLRACFKKPCSNSNNVLTAIINYQ